MTVDGWNLKNRGKKNCFERASPAEEHSCQHEGQDVEVMEDVMEDFGARGDDPGEEGKADHKDHDQRRLRPR